MHHELILGGQRSGKSRCAEARAAGWLARSTDRSAVLLATAVAGDDEMRERIARHRADRAERVPAMRTIEVPHALAGAVREHGKAGCMLVVDCLMLWLTQLTMPLQGEPLSEAALQQAIGDLQDALRASAGPVVLVSNEIGLGLSPLGREARRFVDELGRLHQLLAAQCDRVTLMVAGLEWPLKRASP